MNCEESKISLPHSRLQNIRCWQLTCTNKVFQYVITIRDAYSTALMLCPLVMFITLLRSKHNKMFHTSDRCISVRPCLTMQSFFVVVFSPYALITATQMAYSYFGRRRIRHMFFCDFIPKICHNLLLAIGQQFCFGTMMEKFLQTIPTTLRNRTPRLTLHRVFHHSMTTTKMTTTILNLLHHRIHQIFLCQMILTRRIPAYLLMMMIPFMHHFNHHHDRMMTHQMRKCTHHKMNHPTYHRFHHHYRIIHNHRFPEPMPYLLLQIPLLCPIR